MLRFSNAVIRKKTIILGIVDKATKKVWLFPAKSRHEKHVIAILDKLFNTVGPPKKIISDREFKGKQIESFLKEFGTELLLLPRASPWLNLMERMNQEYKAILRKNPKFSIDQVQRSLNNMPLANVPTCITPDILYSRASQKQIDFVNKISQQIADRRTDRLREVRGKNYTKNLVVPCIGHCVKVQKLNSPEIEFGEIVKVDGSKICTLRMLDDTQRVVHANQIEILDQWDLNKIKRLQIVSK